MGEREERGLRPWEAALNVNQREAVFHSGGPALVLAGPGTGKTTVIIGHVLALLERGAKPEEIFVLTFTRAAAEEMRERFWRTCSEPGVAVTFGTFHSLFFHILRQEGRYRVEDILRENEKRELLKEVLQRRGREGQGRELEGESGDVIRLLLDEFGFVKGRQGTADFVFESKVCQTERFWEIFREYEELRRQLGRIDFDDMIEECRSLFASGESIRLRWQRRCRYLLIDEFQDVNRGQYELARLLAAPQEELFAVGDDDQAIYSFRGADPEIMLSFQKDYPGARIVRLSQNYRSLAPVGELAMRVIGNNKKRYQKELCCQRGRGKTCDFPEGVEVVEALRFSDVRAQVRFLGRRIRDYHRAGVSYGDMAILYRSGVQAEPLLHGLLLQGIPCICREKGDFFYDHWVLRDILAYLRLAAGPQKREDFLRVMNRPSRYLSRSCLTGERVELSRVRRFYQRQPQVAVRVERLERDLERLKRMTPAAAIAYVRLAMDYDSFWPGHCQEAGGSRREVEEVLAECAERAAEYHTLEKWLKAVEEERETFRASRQQSRENGKKAEAVCLSTMHASKGLEYPIVFLPDLNEGVVPHGKSSAGEEMEEERRLFYVALTRARDRLHLYCTEKRGEHRPAISRFFSEMGIKVEEGPEEKENSRLLPEEKDGCFA